MIPKTWLVTRLASLVEKPQYGHTAKASYEIDGPRFLRITDIQDYRVDWSSVPSCDVSESEAEHYALFKHDIVFARTGATTGKSYLIKDCPPKAIFASYLIRIRPRPRVNPEYLWYFFHSHRYWQQIMEKQAGIAQPGVNANKLATLEVVLAPLPEQRRIVAEIEKHFTRLDAAVANLERVRANLKRARASILKAAVEGRLVPTEAELARAEGRDYEPASVLLERILEERKRKHAETNGKKKYEPPVEPDTTGLAELPEGWVWVTVDQLVSAPLRNGKSARATDAPVGVRTLTLTAVTERAFTDANTKLTVATSGEVKGLWLEPGDILVQRSNTPELVGTAALFVGPTDWAIFPDLLIRVRLCSGVPPAWVEFVFRSPRVRDYFKRKAQGIAGSMPKISQEVVARTAVPLPPQAEQQRIVAEVERRLSVIDAIDTTVGRNLIRCSRLRQSILKRAFEGKLVPQDPNDETASELLARLQADATPTKKSPAKIRTRRARKRTPA